MKKSVFLWMVGVMLISGLGIDADASGNLFTDAVAFYNVYGSGNMIFSEGAFYYSSRGKQGDPGGIRYGVLGQRFTMEMERGACYAIEIALESGSNQGSCRRISYVKKDGYYYSLYEVSYDSVFQRMQKRYQDVDFNQLMYNQSIRFQIDFLLALVVNGQEKGSIKELDNGRVQITGTAYESLEQVLDAAQWSKETKKALEYYYGIEMIIFQPSTWYVEYDKNHKSASGSMKKQVFTYGEAQNLEKCSFGRTLTVQFDPVDGTWRGETLEPVYTMVKSRFLGWSLTPDGKKKYKDQQRVRDLLSSQGETLKLYALWSKSQITFPKRKRDDCELMGWSTKKYGTLPADSGEEALPDGKLYQPGELYELETDLTFYAVWKWKQYKVQFQDPEAVSDNSEKAVYFYDLEDVQEIRDLIEACGFAGTRLNRALVRREAS